MKYLVIFSLMISSCVFGQNLTLDWKLQHAISKEFIDAGTHGSIQEILLKRGDLPDPFYGKNEEKFGWIENQPWELFSEFTVDDFYFDFDYLELVFPYVDTYAEIFLNDSLIGFTENAFKPYRFEVKSLLKKGQNKIRAKFYPPVIFHKEMYEKAKYHLPAPNDVHPIAIAPYTRKPQYQFGWDWALRMNTLGFLKPSFLKGSNSMIVLNKNIVTREIHSDYALMDFELLITKNAMEEFTWESEQFGSVKVKCDNGVLRRSEKVDNHILWWPRGQGEHYLYNDFWVVKNAKGDIVHQQKVRYGIRQSSLTNQADQWGTNFEISVNNRPIFCKGADYIPQDVFPSRVKDEDLRKMVETMAASNFNMIRIWGGGYYPDEAFFDACDELGIMVWQDFMFACSMYPGTPDFLTNVAEEVEFQIPRIASHPSLVIFNGNNEVDVAWKNWGFQARYNIYGKDADEVELSYKRLFKELLPQKINLFTNSPYSHTSPLSNWGKDEYYNHGTQHYWGVWHGKDPMENMATKIGRFNAEYGFQSFPEYSTLASFSDKSEWDVQSDVMKHHQKSYVGNLMILKHAKLLYGMPETFEDFVYFSQLTQAHAVSIAVSGHRIDAPRCMGTLYWQLNDCWPAPTWSSLDSKWNWKALQYWVQKDYEDVALLKKVDAKGQSTYHLVSDLPDTFNCQITMNVYDLHGNLKTNSSFEKILNGNESHQICFPEHFKKYVNSNCLIEFIWNNKLGEKKNRTYSIINEKTTIANKFDIQISVIGNDENKKELTIQIKNKKFVQNFWLYSKQSGLKFDKNFIDLLPGKHEFKVKYESNKPDLDSFQYKWM